MSDDLTALLKSHYPYAEPYGVNREFPEKGRDRAAILAELEADPPVRRERPPFPIRARR